MLSLWHRSADNKSKTVTPARIWANLQLAGSYLSARFQQVAYGEFTVLADYRLGRIEVDDGLSELVPVFKISFANYLKSKNPRVFSHQRRPPETKTISARQA
jgi:hypothetical protein